MNGWMLLLLVWRNYKSLLYPCTICLENLMDYKLKFWRSERHEKISNFVSNRTVEVRWRHKYDLTILPMLLLREFRGLFNKILHGRNKIARFYLTMLFCCRIHSSKLIKGNQSRVEIDLCTHIIWWAHKMW